MRQAENMRTDYTHEKNQHINPYKLLNVIAEEILVKISKQKP